MKEIILAVALVGLFSGGLQAAGNDDLATLLERYPNIAVGEVYYENEGSYFVAISGEIQGKLSGKAFETAKGQCADCKLGIGDRVLVFADPASPGSATIRFSRFEGFKGECSFKVIRSLMDSEYLSNLASIANDRAVENAFMF